MEINNMQRIEMKYVLNKEQLSFLRDAIDEYMEIDKYGKTTILSLYYDTPDYRLIRNSIEKPIYKEKIRVRSYGLNDGNSNVFLELKRKAKGIVYKRRITTNNETIEKFFNYESNIDDHSQIAKELVAFRDHYRLLKPSFMVIYDRTAYEEIDGDLRLTIDENPRYRVDNLNFASSSDGTSLLDEGSAILEIKIQEVMPLWLAKLLSKGKIYKTSFSKVGEAYKKEILNKLERKQNAWAHCSKSYPILTKSLSH